MSKKNENCADNNNHSLPCNEAKPLDNGSYCDLEVSEELVPSLDAQPQHPQRKSKRKK